MGVSVEARNLGRREFCSGALPEPGPGRAAQEAHHRLAGKDAGRDACGGDADAKGRTLQETPTLHP
jgi:hypothetical protein